MSSRFWAQHSEIFGCLGPCQAYQQPPNLVEDAPNPILGGSGRFPTVLDGPIGRWAFRKGFWGLRLSFWLGAIRRERYQKGSEIRDICQHDLVAEAAEHGVLRPPSAAKLRADIEPWK